MRFIMLGGFLGAGKTTTIARLARHFQAQGKRVGIVTNDQADDLVDTHNLRSQGFQVGEVAGACFCCNFNDLTATARKLKESEKPDIILAEPVGSCTDLVATVVQPLRDLHRDEFDIAPYAVLLKPSHGRRILNNEPNSGFSPKAAYIFRKQLEEADLIVLNRADQLTDDEQTQIIALIEQNYPDVQVLRMSAKTGDGFDEVLAFIEQDGNFGQRILDIDYDVYAEGEAELGWLNATLDVTSDTEFDLDELLLELVRRMHLLLLQVSAEAAHLKTIGLWDQYHGIANLVSNETGPELSMASECQTKSANLIVNARVAIAPETLQQLVEDTINAVAIEHKLAPSMKSMQSFRPGRPVPTHRYQ